MTGLYISLPAIGCKVTLGQYCAAVRIAKANPEARFRQTFQDWSGGTGSEIVREFRAGLHERINAGSYRVKFQPPARRGRKDCSQWFWQAWRDSRAIRDRLTSRVVINHLGTAEARKRFGHLITTTNEE